MMWVLGFTLVAVPYTVDCDPFQVVYAPFTVESVLYTVVSGPFTMEYAPYYSGSPFTV